MNCTNADVPLKRCSKCGNFFPATREYFAYAQTKSGLGARCKTCKNTVLREWRHKDIEATRKKGREAQRKRLQEKPEEVRAYARERYRNDPEKYRTLQRDRRERDPEGERAKQKAARERNPERYREAARKRRARIAATAIERITAEDILALLKAQKGHCWWCGKLVGEAYHVDHVIPLCRGGEHTIRNLCISCPHCNLTKRHKTPEEFMGRLL